MKDKTQTPIQTVTMRSLVLGTVIAGLFAYMTVLLENRFQVYPTANQIPLLPYVLLTLAVLFINPFLRLIRFIRPFSLPELMVVFVMAMVTSGISTFGLTGQLLPMIGGLLNRHWNNTQTEWCKYIEPYVNENFFISQDGIRKAAGEYAVEARKLAALKSHLPTRETRDQWEKDVEAQEQVAGQKRQVLAELEAVAFEKVELYRRGLPKDKRAIPGIIYTSDDTPETYFRRLGRLRAGRNSAQLLRALPDSQNPQDTLQKAIDLIRPYADTASADARMKTYDTLVEALHTDRARIDARLLTLNQEKRIASLEELRKMEDEIESLDKERERIERKLRKQQKQKEKIVNEYEICDRVKTACESLSALKDAWTPEKRDESLRKSIDILATYPAFDASVARYLVGQLPWSHWLKPIFHWMVLVLLTYLILYTFNMLIFRQWAYHEKLIFPLAELPETIAGLEGGKAAKGIPEVFKNGLFWVGFAIAAGVMGWNLLCNTGWLPGLKFLDLNNSWTPFIRTSMFKGLCYGARSTVFFTLVGLAFLIPQKVSFSLWFFHIFYFVLLLVLVAFGYGQNEGSFPSEWWFTHNFRTGIGTGAIIVFASVVLWKCRHIILCSLRPGKLENVTPAEARELRISSLVFLVSSIALVLCLWLFLGVNFFYALFGYIMIMIFTIGLIRAVAEGGVLGFQSHASPFHLIRHVFGLDKTWTAPYLYAPMMIFYAVLFLDIKAFIAPAMANGFKVSDDLKLNRRRYHLGMLLAFLIAIVVSMATSLILSYDAGADSMNAWFYTMLPRSTYTLIGNVSKLPMSATGAGRGWLLCGALLMAALLFFRQNNFWLPHPIGLIMLINPIMAGYWFSIFLGWLAKALVTRYANKETYGKVRGLFIGLILGEFFIVTLGIILSLLLDMQLNSVTLNRM